MRLLIVGTFWFCSFLVGASELDTLYTRCTQYIQQHDPEKKVQTKILKQFIDRAEQRAKDRNSSVSDELNSVLTDFLWDNMEKIEKQDKVCIFKVCVYFAYYVQKGLPLPLSVSASLTKSKVSELCQWINSQIK